MSGFEWDGGIGGARLNAGQTKQVLRCSQELIALLDQRRDWIRCVISMYPALSPILQPVIHTEHYFRKFQRDFVLKYQPKSDLWRLCFLPKPEDRPPNGNDDIGVARVAAKAAAAETGCVVRDKRGPSDEIRTLIMALRNDVAKRLRDWRAPPELADACRAALEPVVALKGVIQEARATLLAAKQALVERRDEIIASIARWQDEIAESAVQDSFANGRYERRTVCLAGGVTVDVSTVVFDRIDWDSWLFGRRVDEDLLLD